MFGLLSDVLRTAVDVASVSGELTKDAVTLGGVLTKQDKPYTVQAVEKALDSAGDTLDNLKD